MAQQDADQQENVLKDANNQFTARMFTKVVTSNPDKNVVISAFSVLTPLAQLSLASEGTTRDELLTAIGLPNDNVIKTVFSGLNTRLRALKGIELKTVSKIYVTKEADLDPAFSAVSRDVFNSEVENVDFSKNTEAAEEINTWVENQTNNRIKDLVSANDLKPYTTSVLVNAIYFKGKWGSPFNKDSTKEADFHVSKGKTVKVPMMHQKHSLNYADSAELNAQLLELPYSGYQASFIAILPKEVDGIAALLEKLKDPSILELAKSKMSLFKVDVCLPKFKIETETDLKDVLEKLNVSRVFDSDQAQLSHILKGTQNLYVGKAVQKAFIEVNEEGTEAAAGNEAEIFVGSALLPPATFHADHAFVFLLREEQNTIFSGVFFY